MNARDCIKNGGHYVDNQGNCHQCGAALFGSHESLLDEIEEFLDQHADADQPSGASSPIPNIAMDLLTRLKAARKT